MRQKDFSWNGDKIKLLEELHPSLEKLLGETPFPPNEEIVERFIDTLSMYGLHCFPLESWDNIDKSGLQLPESRATYFIADRIVSEKPFYEQEQEREEISASEYMSRFNKSIELVRERIRNKHFGQMGMGILIIDRKKALTLDGFEIVDNAKVYNEWRGEGFLGDARNLWHTIVLDEGHLRIPEKYLPKKAIVGYFLKPWEEGDMSQILNISPASH